MVVYLKILLMIILILIVIVVIVLVIILIIVSIDMVPAREPGAGWGAQGGGVTLGLYYAILCYTNI